MGRKQRFYTDKQGRARPITPRTPHIGTLQKGTAHLNPPKTFTPKTATIPPQKGKQVSTSRKEKVVAEDAEGKWQFDKAMANEASWDEEVFDRMIAETVKTLDAPETNEFWKQYNEWKRTSQE